MQPIIYVFPGKDNAFVISLLSMKLIENIEELKKGDILIIKDNEYFYLQGYQKINGEVFVIDKNEQHFSIKCKETKSIDRININDGKIFLIS
jgi:hypothetical protein